MDAADEIPFHAALPMALSLAVAIGTGMLIGIERERRKALRGDPGAAGLRSFMLAACCGALAQGLGIAGLVPVGGLMIAMLAALAYFRSPSPDHGPTTALALFATYLIGVLSMRAPALGAAIGAGLAVLLISRSRLHRLVTDLLSEQEMRDGVVLIAAALILLPLVPSRPLAILGGMNPRPLAGLVVLIMAMQATGHLALRHLGPRGGALLYGLLAGFVSSTACIASMGSQTRQQPGRISALAGVAAVSGAATWMQALLLSAALSPEAALALLPASLAGALGSGGLGMAMARPRGPAQSTAIPPVPESRSALRPREALLVVLMLAGVSLLVSNAQSRLGNTAAGIGVALAALADAHAPIASLAGLHVAGRLSIAYFVGGVLLAISVNTLTRCVVAVVAGGGTYAWRVGTPLLAGVGLAWLAALGTAFS